MSQTEKAIPTPLSSYVGFDSIPMQLERQVLKQPFVFNLLVVGRSGLGKSTFVNTLFSGDVIESTGVASVANFPKTTSITSVSHGIVSHLCQVLEENGVRLKLTITDTPGFGDQLNNENCWEPIVKYIKDQHAMYLRKELAPIREKKIEDTRVHCVLYFISPSGHSLTPLDIFVMKKLTEYTNVLPVIAKSDSLTIEEREAFKNRIRAELGHHQIAVYPFNRPEEFVAMDDPKEQAVLQYVMNATPFCVIGSERNLQIEGKLIRGRRSRFGFINIDDEGHCDFAALRNFLMRTHLQDLVECTKFLHYENFRSKQLMALKEQSGGK